MLATPLTEAKPPSAGSLSCRNAALALAARDGVSGTIRDPWMLLRVGAGAGAGDAAGLPTWP